MGKGRGDGQRLIVHKSSRSIVSGEPPADVVPMDRRPTCPSTSTAPSRSLWVGGVISGPHRHDASSQSQLKTNTVWDVEMVAALEEEREAYVWVGR